MLDVGRDGMNTPPVACPPSHVVYLSQSLADNAVTLHAMSRPHCAAYNAFVCGDHWHAGHPDKTSGDACKTNPEHLETKRRIQRVCRTNGRR